MSIFSDIPIRSNGDDVDASWWNIIRTAMINAFGGSSRADALNALLPSQTGNENKALITDGTNASWASAGGGGGGSLQWVEGYLAPIPSVVNANSNGNALIVYLFSSGVGQSLYATIKVPNSYTSGNQIKMIMAFYSPDSSGTAYLFTETTRIRPGSDDISSLSNQYDSTNSAVTLSSGTVNKPQNIIFDLTDSSGQISSHDILPNDLLIINLSRLADTATSDLSVLVYGAEVTFN